MTNKKPWLKSTEDKEVTVMGCKIILKPLSFGDSRKALNIATKVNYVSKTQEIDSGLIATLRALYSIKSWDLTDENDEPLKIELNTLDSVLDEEFVAELIQATNADTDSGVTIAEKK